MNTVNKGYEIKPKMGNIGIEHSSLANTKSRHEEFINSHHFNHSVQIVKSGENQIDLTALENFRYFQLNIDLNSLIFLFYIPEIIGKGFQCGVCSIKTRVDSGNTLSITADGILVLQLDKKTYLKAGVEVSSIPMGNKQHVMKSEQDVYKRAVIDLNHLTEKQSIRLKKSFQNFTPVDVVLYCLNQKNEPVQDLQMLLSKEIKQSIHSYQERKLEIVQDKLQDVYLPNPPFTFTEMPQLLDTIGLISLNLKKLINPHPQKTSQLLQEYLTRFQQSFEKRTITYLRLKGLIPPSMVRSLLQTISSEKIESWSSLLVTGFDDANISWSLKPHEFITSGENDFCFILPQSECKEYFLLKMTR